MPSHLATAYDWRQSLAAETRRMRSELGYIEKISVEEGLRRAVEWERANPPWDVDAKRFDYWAEELALSRITN
jgi:nucleoside-diphosphate-sugar epimerase